MAAAAPDSDSSNSRTSSINQDDKVDEWLEQKKKERITELKSISKVGATANQRKVLEEQLQRQQENDATESERAGERNAVVVEVRGLFETRPVTRLLQSNGFRRHLENIVRSVVTQEPTPTPSRQQAAAVSQESVPVPAPRRRRTQAPPVPAPPAPTPAPTSAPAPAPTSAPAQAPPPTLFYTPRATAAPGDTADLLRHQHREEFIAEVSELLHRQLVSSTLESEFRGSLERQMRGRLDGDGQAALDTLQRLPPSGVIRNDFSHLGLHVAQAAAAAAAAAYAASEGDDDDAVSIISATAQTVPVSETSAGLARQMAAMRREMCALKEQLQLQMELQMDLQRMVRQEVAAAMHHTHNESTQPQPPVNNAGKCLICLETRADTVLYRCGHLCVCYPCGARMRQQGHTTRQAGQGQTLFTCPVCRAPVYDMIRAFAAGVENEDE